MRRPSPHDGLVLDDLEFVFRIGRGGGGRGRAYARGGDHRRRHHAGRFLGRVDLLCDCGLCVVLHSVFPLSAPVLGADGLDLPQGLGQVILGLDGLHLPQRLGQVHAVVLGLERVRLVLFFFVTNGVDVPDGLGEVALLALRGVGSGQRHIVWREKVSNDGGWKQGKG